MKDMTEGKPLKLIVNFAIPMLIGNIFQQIYNVVDTMVVGRFLGEEALAGVGSTGSLNGFLLALVWGLCSGAGLIIAQCYGSKDFKKLKEAVIALVWVAFLFTILLAAIGLIGMRTFLRWLSVPDSCIEYSVSYLKIIYALVGGSVIYNGAASVLRSVGDSKTPLYALIASALTNTVLDVVFVLFFNLGVEGVAYATVISQHLSAVIAMFFLLRKRKELGLTDIDWKPNWPEMGQIFKTGFPSAFQSSMISLGGMSVQRLINSYGATVMAAYIAANKVDSVAIQVIVSIGTSLSVFTGQNIGGNRYDRIKEGLRKTLALMVGSAITIAVLVFTFRYQLIALFLGSDASEEAFKVGTTYLTIIGVAYVIAGIMQSYQNVIRGAGDVNTCMVAGLTELSGKIIFAYLLSHFIGSTGIWIATPISWSCGCIVPLVRYYSGKWKLKKLV